MRALGRRPDRDKSSTGARDPAPLVTGHGSFDIETLLVGVIKSVVDFLLGMFRVHAVSTIVCCFHLSTAKLQIAARDPTSTGFLRQACSHLSFHDLLQQHDCLVIEVDAQRSSLRGELQREPLCFGRVAGCVLGADPHRQ